MAEAKGLSEILCRPRYCPSSFRPLDWRFRTSMKYPWLFSLNSSHFLRFYTEQKCPKSIRTISLSSNETLQLLLNQELIKTTSKRNLVEWAKLSLTFGSRIRVPKAPKTSESFARNGHGIYFYPSPSAYLSILAVTHQCLQKVPL